jgi:hypothetical protein
MWFSTSVGFSLINQISKLEQQECNLQVISDGKASSGIERH